MHVSLNPSASTSTSQIPQFDFTAPISLPQPHPYAPSATLSESQMLAPTPTFSDFVNTPTNTNGVDPAQFVWAFSSRLPTVEESSPFNEGSSKSDPSPKEFALGQGGGDGRRKSKGAQGKEAEGKIVKITWWRPHGQTAIAPGTFR
jgi:hypothetical protein